MCYLDCYLISMKYWCLKLRSHSALSATNRRSPRGQPRRAQSRQHAFCIERSHSAADSAATDGNAVKVENSSTVRAFPSVDARSAAVESGKLHISYVDDDRAARGDSPLTARCENAALVSYPS